MPGRWGRLLCRLGIHRWRYLWGYVEFWRCDRCSAEKLDDEEH